MAPTRSSLYVWLGVSLLLACGDEDPSPEAARASACLHDYARERGFEPTSPDTLPVELADGSVWDLPVGLSPEATEADCHADGRPCAAARFLSRAAALCLAEIEGMRPGLTPWAAGLVYNFGFRRPIWVVQNLEYTAPSSFGGDCLVFDAAFGTVLQRCGWGASLD